MKHINQILEEKTLNLDNTEKAVIASMAISPSDEMAYGVLVGARNSVSAGESLQRGGFIEVDDANKAARLTSKGKEVLVADNLTDETGELTDRGQELVKTFRNDRDEWQQFESIRSLTSTVCE
jgi:predicted transcriptional regulator